MSDASDGSREPAVAGPGSFNFADIWEMAADLAAGRDALVVGDQRRTYAQLDERANRLAHYLAGRGVGPGDHVALYLENCAEYVEAMLAAFKLRAVPINVNHRYVAGELRHLLDNSDSTGVVTEPSRRSTVDAVLGSGDLPGVGFVLATGDDYEGALATSSRHRPTAARRGDDRYIIYTGGTTGTPKGVEWRQEDAFFACIGGGDPMRIAGPVERPAQLVDRMLDQQVCYMTLAPMMHAAAQWTALSWLFCGGKVVLMAGSLDPEAAWRAVEAESVQVLTVVGDAMARPLLDTWEAHGGRDGFDIGSLFAFSNGGAPLAPATRRRVFDTFPHLMVNDGFGSSEAGVQGSSRLAADDPGREGTVVSFDRPAKPTIVVGPEGREVEPGSGVVGQVLAGGRLPLGYYGDPARTAETFVERDGARWLVTGDMATVAQDGAICLVGRGSGVVNTGGEKVFPEEVEGVLKAHAAVYDCLVVGVPDDHWGSAVAAVVEPAGGAVTLDDLVTHCKDRMAGFKAPKHLVLVDRVERSPSGKADYRWAQATARAAVAG